jgi:hypothetical protein
MLDFNLEIRIRGWVVYRLRCLYSVLLHHTLTSLKRGGNFKKSLLLIHLACETSAAFSVNPLAVSVLMCRECIRHSLRMLVHDRNSAPGCTNQTRRKDAKFFCVKGREGRSPRLSKMLFRL